MPMWIKFEVQKMPRPIVCGLEFNLADLEKATNYLIVDVVKSQV